MVWIRETFCVYSTMEDLKRLACEAIDRQASRLRDVSSEIWMNPELGFEEHRAHSLLTDLLGDAGFQVDKKFTLETAFRAKSGTTKRPNVAIMCEYDALPNIGHACGHNLIAEAGCAAGIGVKAALESSDQSLGCVTVFGTPAEEGGNGKVKMLSNGCFKDADIAMMAHPLNADYLNRYSLALLELDVTYKGKASHAAAFPWEGINALDAAVMAYTNMSMMRQQMKPTWRVHGIVTNGGIKPNIIPEESQLQYYIRAPTEGELKTLKCMSEKIFHSAAKATGCSVEIVEGEGCSNVLVNSVLADAYCKNCASLKFDFKPPVAGGSTDMGNISYAIPSIHPYFNVGTSASIHSQEFTAAANTDYAHERAISAGKAMAMTAIEILCVPELLPSIRTSFDTQVATAISS